MPKVYTAYFSTMYSTAARSVKICDIPALTVLEWQSDDWIAGMSLVTYQTSKKPLTGWVATCALDPYTEQYPAPLVDLSGMQTPNPVDAAQYVIRDVVTEYKFCGEIAACMILGVSLAALLETWERERPASYKAIFHAPMHAADGLGLDSLCEIFAAFGRPVRRIDDHLKSLAGGRNVITPARLQAVCQKSDVIVSTKINTVDGSLAPAGALHWVTILSVAPDGAGRGSVIIGNPFTNKAEPYSWRELVASMGVPYGVIVERVTI